MDNPFDCRVMVSYLKQFFDSSMLSESGRGNKRLGPLKLPTSMGYRVSTVIGGGDRGWSRE